MPPDGALRGRIRRLEQEIDYWNARYDDKQKEHTDKAEKAAYQRSILLLVEAWKRFDIQQEIRQLEHGLAEDEQTIADINSRLIEYEDNLACLLRADELQRLYDALLRLDYFDQAALFRSFTDRHPIGAFLVSGGPRSGQPWLLHRLIRQAERSGEEEAKVVRLSLGSRAGSPSVDRLWERIARPFGAPHSFDHFAEQVWQSLQTKSVVLVFDGLESMPDGYTSDLFQQLLIPLSRKVCENSRVAGCLMPNGPCVAGDGDADWHRNLLLMFVMLHSESADIQDVGLVTHLDDMWHCGKAISLPHIAAFSQAMIEQWLQNSVGDLPRRLIGDTGSLTQCILEGTDGYPEDVLKRICEKCGYDAEERMKEWQRRLG